MRKDLAGGFHDSGFTSFGRAVFPQLGVNVNKNMIRKFSLTLRDITESVAKTIAVRKRAEHSLAEVDNRTVLDYLLAEQGVVCIVANTTCCTWINTSGEVKTQLRKIIEQPTWLKKHADQPTWNFLVSTRRSGGDSRTKGEFQQLWGQ